MDEKKGSAATRAKNKYNAANYDRLYPYVPKGRKAVYEEAATKAGVSLNDYIIKALDEKVERDKKEREG
ncbi:transcriptional regulator [Paenibacillus oleatilyticus]|nr:transcriptional regulator [Paenibacillus oleatilyticus]MBU7320836.1 transcriptional regulator [Paenibacillus oleatilyticus]